MVSKALLVACAAAGIFDAAAAQYSATYYPSATGLPKTTEQGQSGTNDCGTESSQTSNCQNFYINDVTDFCVWAPPNGGEVADNEAVEVSYCTKSGYGTRVIPEGTITGAHFVKTPNYVQVTGVGDFTKIGIIPNDAGGELDPHGATGEGNPVGGLVFHNGRQMHEWFSFMSSNDFCTRACFDGPRATSLCRHTYDELGCGFNAPGNYGAGVFEDCDGNNAQDIMYNYPGLSTFQQADTSYGVQVPSPHPAPASSQCTTFPANALAGTASGFGSPSSSSASSTSSSTSMSSTASSTSMTSSASSSSTTAAAFITADHSGDWSSSSSASTSVKAQAVSTNGQNAAGGLLTLLGDRQSAVTYTSLFFTAVVAAFAL